MRDAIVCGYGWGAGASAIERVAVALARAGARVLHCAAPISRFKGPDTRLRQVEPNLFTSSPWVYSHRLNRFPGMRRIQGEMATRQILRQARALGLERPAFLYAYLGQLLAPICETMRRRGCPLVYVEVDYAENLSSLHIGQSDLTLVFSRTLYHRMRACWGERIRCGFLGVDLRPFRGLRTCPESPPPALAEIQRPRLGYGGGFAWEVLNTRVLYELLDRRRDWHFLSFGQQRHERGIRPAVPLPNAHVLPWQSSEEYARCVASIDVGFMPYDCSNVVLFNNPPMKLWDYFALGLPVVATPLVHLWEYDGLVYLGETAQELEAAVEKSLAEPPNSPLREQRKAEAEKHSMEAMSRLLEQVLS